MISSLIEPLDAEFPTMSHQLVEAQLKFRVHSSFRLPQLEGEALPSSLFTSVYYDTPTHRLALHGLTLRYRIEQHRGCWQLMIPKSQGRVESEFPGRRAGPPDPLSRLLLAYLRGDVFKPVATLRTRRTGVHIGHGDEGRADCVLDAVEVLDGRKVARRFSEITLEHHGIESDQVQEWVHQLKKAGAEPMPCIPAVLQVIGVAMPSFGTMPDQCAAPDVQLQSVLGRHVHHLLLHDPGARLPTDPEDLHEMRVAIRKLRAILRAARPMLSVKWAEALRKELAWLAAALAPARDLDVLLMYLLKEGNSFPPPERAALQPLCASLEAERASGQLVVAQALESDRYLSLLDRLESAAARPEITHPDMALADLARRAYRRLKQAMRACPPEPSPEWLHQLRIKSKRARYAAELAEPAGGKAVSRFMKALKVFQDLLGEHQDALVAEQRLRQWSAEISDPLAALTTGQLIERQCERQRAVRSCLLDVWKKTKKRGNAAWSS